RAPAFRKNLEQTAATRAEMEGSREEADAVPEWMRRLPLWIERADLRVPHAAWSRQSMATLKPVIDSNNALSAEGFVRAARIDDEMRKAREVLLNGPEATLPFSYRDRHGHLRRDGRLAWWKAGLDGSYPAKIA